MEDFQKIYRKLLKDTKSAASSSSSLSEFAENWMQDKRGSVNSTSYDGSGILVDRPPSGVSVWTCLKLCGAFFVAGVFVGYTLKRRVRRWDDYTTTSVVRSTPILVQLAQSHYSLLLLLYVSVPVYCVRGTLLIFFNFLPL